MILKSYINVKMKPVLFHCITKTNKTHKQTKKTNPKTEGTLIEKILQFISKLLLNNFSEEADKNSKL